MKPLLVAICIVAALGLPAAHAVQPDEIMSDRVEEARARDLSRELRWMVGQNQSIDDSEAPLARDLRLLVRERIAAGDSDAQVLDFLVARYGQFVLLKPKFEPQTFLLWLATPFVLVGGGVALWMYSRRRSKVDGEMAGPALTAEEEVQLRELMTQDTAQETTSVSRL